MPQVKNRRGPGRGPISFEKPKNLKHTVTRLLSYLKNSKLQITIVIVSLAISTLSSLIGSYFLKPLINNYILPGDFKGLAGALVILGLIYIVGSIAAYVQTRFTINVAQRTLNVIRKDLFDKMQGLGLKTFDTHTHGELMSRFTNDADNVQLMLEQSITQLFSSVLTFIGCIILMLALSPILFLITAVIIVLMIFVSKKIGGKSKAYFGKQQKVLGELDGYIEENISGLKEVKVFNHENIIKRGFGKLNEEFRATAANANFLAGIIMPIMGNLNNICYAATAVFGGILTINGMFDIGSLGAFLQFSRQVGMPINQIASQMNNVLAAMAGAERIFNMMDQKPETDDGKVTLKCIKSGKEIAWAWEKPDGTTVPLKGDVRFDQVNFSYEPEKPVLKDISLYAKPGQVIAFVGSTGAGKTTITNLINRFYDVQSGTITYDGIDVNEIKKDSLRSSLGMVLQDTHLFTGTIIDNIRYGRLDATDEECVNAAKMASADSFISRLPEGYHTFITGDGANLSQGQRQLLAIARAYVDDPPVMILDEATSSIDTRTEKLIAEGMNALMKGRTVFVIAHRLSTVRNADAILVLEHGEIIERGNHDELLKKKGRYYELYTGKSKLD